MSSSVVRKEPCPACGSKDNLVRYDDGHAFCFGAGCGHYEHAEEPKVTTLADRKLTKKTLDKFDYGIDDRGNECARYYSPLTRRCLAQKVRTPDKKFYVEPKGAALPLYGQHLHKGGGRRLIITEGEIDAMTVSQVLGHKWPVVSLPNGAGSAKKAVTENLEWINSFEQVVFCFDNDKAGREALGEVLHLGTPGKVHIVRLPLKDASAMHMAGRDDELVRCLWDAEKYSPTGILRASDVVEDAKAPPEWGIPYWQDDLTEVTYGRRMGEVVGLGAGTGTGKTTWLIQQITYDLERGHKVGVFAFEQSPTDTVRRVASVKDGVIYYTPDGKYKEEDRDKALDWVGQQDLFLYDNFGAADWADVKERIRYLYHSEGVKIFFIDHLTALSAMEDDENKHISKMMIECSMIAKELGVWILYISHLTTPERGSHEEGARVTIRQFRGSRTIGYWTHFIFGLERDQQEEDDDEKNSVIFRVLKDRNTGRSLGKTWRLSYNQETGLLSSGENFKKEQDFGQVRF